MKRILLFVMLAIGLTSCSVDNEDIYPIDVVNAEMAVSPDCEYLNAGPDNSMTITESEAAAIGSWDEVRKMYQSLLAQGVSKYGTFSPTIDEIIARFQKERIGDFTTTYTITDGDCSDSVDLTVTVIVDEPACEPVSAGADNSITMEESDAAAIESWDEVRKLYLSLLESGVSSQGSFNPSIDEIIAKFQAERIGDFTTTYTVGEGECTDSVKLTVTVIEDVPNCTLVDAGPDNMITLTVSEAAAIPSWDEVRKLYLSLLASGVSRSGTFDPSIDAIIARFQSQPLGDFTTTYTIGDGECTDSVNLTVRVIEDVPSCEPVYAGKDGSKTLTEKQARTQGSTYGSVEQIFFRMLEPGVSVQGKVYSFNPSIDQLIADFGESPIGVFSTTLTIGEGECQDSVNLTLTVVP